MFSLFITCPQYPERYLPIAATSNEKLCFFGCSIANDAPGAFEHLINQMGSRLVDKTGVRSAFLDLIQGIRIEMIAEKLTPMVMADKLIKIAKKMHPALIQELHNCEDWGNDAASISPLRKRLSDRLGRMTTKPLTKEVIAMGRLVARFAICGTKMAEFTD